LCRDRIQCPEGRATSKSLYTDSPRQIFPHLSAVLLQISVLLDERVETIPLVGGRSPIKRVEQNVILIARNVDEIVSACPSPLTSPE
jgi:hypothetical protein